MKAIYHPTPHLLCVTSKHSRHVAHPQAEQFTTESCPEKRTCKYIALTLHSDMVVPCNDSLAQNILLH